MEQTTRSLFAILCIVLTFSLLISCSEPETQIIEPPSPLPMALPDSVSVFRIFFTDSLHGWLSVRIRGNYTYYGGIFNTSDGGFTWFASLLLDSSVIQQMTFIDANNGWVAGTRGYIASTSDGGKTWKQFNTDNLWGSTAQAVGFGGIRFLNKREGWLVGSIQDGRIGCTGSGFVLRTTDGGNNWQSIYQTTEMGLSGISMFPTGETWVVGAGHYIDCPPYIKHSTDFGYSWTRQPVNSSFNGNTYRSFFYNPAYGYVTGAIGILRTTNGGIHWDTTGSGIGSASDVAIVSDSIVYVLGGISYERSFGVYKSTDKGITWVKNLALKGNYNSMFFLDSSHAWVAGLDEIDFPNKFSLFHLRSNVWTKIR